MEDGDITRFRLQRTGLFLLLSTMHRRNSAPDKDHEGNNADGDCYGREHFISP